MEAGRGKGGFKMMTSRNEKDFCMSIACVTECFFFVQGRFMRPSVSLFLHILSVTSPLIRAVLSPKTSTRV